MNTTKKILAIGLTATALFFAGCTSNNDAPLTENQQAEKYNLTLKEYREQKDAAASMGMSIDEHLNMGH